MHASVSAAGPVIARLYLQARRSPLPLAQPMPRTVERLVRHAALALAAIVAVTACGSPAPAPAQDEEPAALRSATGPGYDSTLAATVEAGEQQAISQLPLGPGRDVVTEACLICHGAALIQLQRKDRDHWTRSVRGMVDWGAPLSVEQEEVVVDYLVEHFGPEPTATP